MPESPRLVGGREGRLAAYACVICVFRHTAGTGCRTLVTMSGPAAEPIGARGRPTRCAVSLAGRAVRGRWMWRRPADDPDADRAAADRGSAVAARLSVRSAGQG